jgi:2-oxo-4-hydroxy-4-carboxy-5-ureidoimidazoline decarboxylase
MTAALQSFNGMTTADAVRQLMTLCGSTRWANAVAAARPLTSADDLRRAMARAFDQLSDQDWLEAFRHHPRIGDVTKLRERFGATAHLSESEQRGIAGANESTLQALHQRNQDYEARFGHVFLICATGKSATEMLAALEARIDNAAAAELAIAAAEQRKITDIRFNRWMAS